MLAETKDHWNWEMLADVTDQIEDGELKKIAIRAVREVSRRTITSDGTNFDETRVRSSPSRRRNGKDDNESTEEEKTQDY